MINPVSILKNLRNKPESYWQKRGEEQALKLFHKMAVRVPAYKDFLKKNKVNTEKIKTIKDFELLPTTDKNNYVRAYPLEKLCWDGALTRKQWTFSVTSGSTGEPTYFPRQSEQDWQYALTAELYLLNNFEINKKSTLYIDAFAMGAWIGGIFTFSAIRHVAERGKYPLSIITPGIHKDEIISAIKKLGPNFDQIIIGGYPPFIKDLVDYAAARGLNWKDYDIGFVFSAEAFSEDFRDYIIKKAGLNDIHTKTLNHYGTVDMGTMAHETPYSIWIRRMALSRTEIYKSVFGSANKLPTLAQYIPEMFYFESDKGSLYCSAFCGLPLVRYDLKDHGDVIGFEKMREILRPHGLSGDVQFKSAWHIPFVHIYERSDLAVSLYGANIYPETVRNALMNVDFNDFVTGKFSMRIVMDNAQNPSLEINTEMRQGIRAHGKLKNTLSKRIMHRLLAENSEYEIIFSQMKAKVIPKVVLLPYESQKYFKSEGKQKWIVKN